jgi:tetratricopeptide (TPR) repeat protein
VVLTLLVLATALALGGALSGGFVWDDGPLIVKNLLIKDPGNIPRILTSGFWETGDQHDRFRQFFRPVIVLSFMLDHAVWGLRPFGFHLTNLLLHLGCCWLVYRLGLLDGIRAWPALAGAALFAAHPVHVESVAWISGRTDVLCGLLVLASFAAYRQSADTSSPGLRVASWALFGLALFAKEMAAPLPLLVLADRWLDAPGRRGRTARAWSACWPFLAVLALYVGLRTAALGGGVPPVFSLDAQSHIASALFVLARYCTLLLLPVGLDAHYPYQPLSSLLAPTALLSATILGLVVFSLVRFARRSSRVRFWALWIFVGLLPVMAFGRFGDVLMAERFLYLPSVGLALLFGRGVAFLADGLTRVGRRRLVAGLASVVVVLGGMSLHRTRVWRDDFALFSDMVETSPRSALVRNNLGLALYERGQFGGARDEFELATRLSDTYSLAHNNLAAATEREGRYEQALIHYRQAIRLAPGLIEAETNYGNLLVRLGRPGEGLPVLRDVAARHPGSPAALYGLADALSRVGRSDEALPLLARILEIDERHAEAHYLLGKIRYEQDRRVEAAAAMRRFLELWSGEAGEHSAAARRVIAEVEGAGAPPASD